ncbi:type I-F CRISPR-associated protein Csy1 [Maridesulfovibrio bastinii]|uniref:type I-F CRISPR-associated protein Csy1 n=1 Tax=Maridesulfovibrio bastinii TaxID=47157 RepID=UPI000403A33B|nr:type I-F CRISPR-associated protein Csy1 [Maridesulfovibrio bastinii]
MSEVNQDEVDAIRKVIDDYLKSIADSKSESFFKKIAKYKESIASDEALPADIEKAEKGIAEEELNIEKVRSKYETETWLLDAAKRAGWIQLVSHTPKNMNSCAKGASGLFCSTASKSIPDEFVSSFSIGAKSDVNDAVGNAAALDVNKFLQTEYKGRSLLSMLLEDDKNFQMALADNSETAKQIFDGFKEFIKEREPSAHSLTKQVYFPVSDGYHLLLPLYPSVLVSNIHEQLSSDFFSEEVKAARKARKGNDFCEQPIHSYPDLAVQSFGGSKPQNISQLNSMRHGKSYLLPSLPPMWKSAEISIPRRSIFSSSLYYRRNVRYWVKALGEYLKKLTVDNMNTRHGRDKILAAIVDDVLNYAMELRSLPSAWSASPEYKLPDYEKKWLDVGYPSDSGVQDDEWLELVCHNFALTLNARLKKFYKIEVDNSTYNIWKTALKTEMKKFNWEGGL